MEQDDNNKALKQTSNLLKLQSKVRKIKKDNRIKIDISKTEYPLLRLVSVSQLGWRIWTRQQSKEQINIFWIDTYVTEEQVRKLKSYQRINHIPGSQNLGKKNLLSYNINQMKKKGLKDFNFYPQTFNIPIDTQQLEKFQKSRQNEYYIVKPCCDSQGRGIYIGNFNQLSTKQQLVIQEYIQNPLLIEGMKFDLRIYVLIKSIFPLKIYIYEQGLCRLATCQYEKPTINNKKNMKMHLTNYAINKLSPNFIFNKSEEEDNMGHKRSLSAAMQSIEQMGCDIGKLQEQIDSIIVKTILSAYPLISKRYKELTRDHDQSLCFEILGFDILIKDNFQPILLEVNHTPSFCTETPLDMVIKKYLILDTLNLMNLNHEDKITFLKNNRSQNDANIFPFPGKINKHVCKDIQPQELGGYRKIYPLDASPQNQNNNKAYQHILKIIKIEKIARFNRTSCFHHPKHHHQNKHIHPDNIQKIISNNSKLQAQSRPFSLYSLISNLRKQQTESFQDYDFKTPFNRDSFKAQEQQLTLFDTALHNDFLIKKQLLPFENRNKKQKKKSIIVMPLNSINIRLDEKFTHRQSKSETTKAVHHYNEYPFKIHSILNATNLFQNLKEKYDDPKTVKNMLRKFKQSNQIQQMNKRHQVNMTSYTSFIQNQAKLPNLDNNSEIKNKKEYYQMRNKLQRVNFTSVTTNKIKKNDRGHYIVIKNKSKSKDYTSQFHKE